jgi:hypothetical protein
MRDRGKKKREGMGIGLLKGVCKKQKVFWGSFFYPLRVCGLSMGCKRLTHVMSTYFAALYRLVGGVYTEYFTPTTTTILLTSY